MVSNPRKEALGEPIPEQDLWPLAEAVRLRIEQIRSWARGVVSIEDAMQRGKLRSARWDSASGKPEPELLLPEFWQAHLILYEFPNKPIANIPIANIYPRTGVREWGPWAYNPLHRAEGEYYVSRSDYEKLWSLEPGPSQADKPAEKQTELSQGGKPGRKTTDKWKFHAASVICRIVLEEDRKPTAEDVSQVLDKENINFTPDRREINRLIASLLRLLE
jgi:hypothetical protein